MPRQAKAVAQRVASRFEAQGDGLQPPARMPLDVCLNFVWSSSFACMSSRTLAKSDRVESGSLKPPPLCNLTTEAKSRTALHAEASTTPPASRYVLSKQVGRCKLGPRRVTRLSKVSMRAVSLRRATSVFLRCAERERERESHDLL